METRWCYVKKSNLVDSIRIWIFSSRHGSILGSDQFPPNNTKLVRLDNRVITSSVVRSLCG